ncbi:purine-nucleoside phosphorylase [Anatilimnocola aggregata]|nr:purine-nucleoside phosphorylase [Anatilimnocola aggregata]
MNAIIHHDRDRMLQDALAVVRARWTCTPEVAIILGTGLGDLADEIAAEQIIPYREIPHFPHSTALAHKGNFICGRIDDVPVIVMQGRCHLYEGYPVEQATLPVRVMQSLGAKTLIVSNAAGGVNPLFEVGDVMIIEDHIQLMFLEGLAPFSTGQTDRMPRVQARLYCPKLVDAGLKAARELGFACQRGVYVAVTGPSYETRAEYRMFRRMGDVVGMSTVPEVLVAASCGLRVFGISTVTNIARPDAIVREEVDAEHVVKVAQKVQHKVRALVHGVLAAIRDEGLAN